MGVIMIKGNVCELSGPFQVLKKGLFNYCGDKLHNNKLQEAINTISVKHYCLSFVILYNIILK